MGPGAINFVLPTGEGTLEVKLGVDDALGTGSDCCGWVSCC